MWEPQPLATLRASTACTGKTLPYHKEVLSTEMAFEVQISTHCSHSVLLETRVAHHDCTVLTAA
jgi:hypothetical protein